MIVNRRLLTQILELSALGSQQSSGQLAQDLIFVEKRREGGFEIGLHSLRSALMTGCRAFEQIVGKDLRLFELIDFVKDRPRQGEPGAGFVALILPSVFDAKPSHHRRQRDRGYHQRSKDDNVRQEDQQIPEWKRLARRQRQGNRESGSK